MTGTNTIATFVIRVDTFATSLTRKDLKLLCKKTPIPEDKLPYWLTNPPVRVLQPPRLWLGWNMGTDAQFWEFLKTHRPKSKDWKLKDDGSVDPDKFHYMALSMYVDLAIDRKAYPQLDIKSVWNSSGEVSWLVSMGCNWYKDPPTELIEKVRNYVGISEGEEPMWYLDHIYWRWVFKGKPVRGKSSSIVPT